MFIIDLNVRVDIGVVIFFLYVDNIEEIEVDEEFWISFDIYFDIYNVDKVVRSKVKVEG